MNHFNSNTASLIVVVPVYKNAGELKDYEIVSIRNTIDKASIHAPIALVKPRSLNADSYSELFGYSFDSVSFDDYFFSSIYTYNLLLKSLSFFESFQQFEYMLLVQTDAFIFDFEFNEFFQFDFIGGPWQQHIFDTHIKTLHCGNGGFSLRNIPKAVAALNQNIQTLPFKKIRRYTFESEFHTDKSFLRKAWDTLYFYFFQNQIRDGKNGLPFLYEDVFWSLIVPVVYTEFKVPDGQTALKFAFDTYPEICFEQNKRQLPKGCHGFNKYSPDFWRKYISF